jgi:hypothetical protein
MAIGYQDSFPDLFTAFMVVWFKDLEFVEGGWQDQKLSYEDADLIIDRCLVAEASN